MKKLILQTDLKQNFELLQNRNIAYGQITFENLPDSDDKILIKINILDGGEIALKKVFDFYPAGSRNIITKTLFKEGIGIETYCDLLIMDLFIIDKDLELKIFYSNES